MVATKYVPWLMGVVDTGLEPGKGNAVTWLVAPSVTMHE